MRFLPTGLAGCHEIRPEPRVDARGSFARLYCPQEFSAADIDFRPVQINESRNTRRHTLRGMHFQAEPHAEAKVVSVTRGSAFDVVLDLRPASPTYRHWQSFALDERNGTMVYIPEGCAHGFLTLADDTTVQYLMGRAYVPGKALGYRFDDPAFGIGWPAVPEVIGDADLAWPAFEPSS